MLSQRRLRRARIARIVERWSDRPAIGTADDEMDRLLLDRIFEEVRQIHEEGMAS